MMERITTVAHSRSVNILPPSSSPLLHNWLHQPLSFPFLLSMIVFSKFFFISFSMFLVQCVGLNWLTIWLQYWFRRSHCIIICLNDWCNRSAVEHRVNKELTATDGTFVTPSRVGRCSWLIDEYFRFICAQTKPTVMCNILVGLCCTSLVGPKFTRPSRRMQPTTHEAAAKRLNGVDSRCR